MPIIRQVITSPVIAVARETGETYEGAPRKFGPEFE
jgi:hypothetical protein